MFNALVMKIVKCGSHAAYYVAYGYREIHPPMFLE